MRKTLSAVGLLLLLGWPLACGSDDDEEGALLFDSCDDLCSAAQQASCTIVDCDCGQFCSSLLAFKGKGGCDSTASAYEDCALRQEACSVSSNCSSEENAFTGCVQQFCVSNPNDSDCVFLMTC
jgi:hypothetical protein